MKGKSKVTAYHHLGRLARICSKFTTTPNAIAALTRKEVYRFLLDMVAELESQGYAGSDISNYVKAARS